MMRQTSLLKWSITKNKSNNNQHHHQNGNKSWTHPAEALQRGHIAYLVKFLGNTEVDQPKGIDVVKEGIRKMKFTEHLKRAEGAKSPKVELTISIDGVAVQEPKSKKILHQYPLHRISYCADDKADKKFFSFIAKDADAERHVCFVFVSDKLAEEITLTIGQAFDLAYRRFLETSGRDLEMRRQLMILQKRVQELEKENEHLKAKVTDYEARSKMRKKSIELIETNGLSLAPPLQPPPAKGVMGRSFSASHGVSLLDVEVADLKPSVGRKLENLSLSDMADLEENDDDDFNPRALDGSTNGLTNGVHKMSNGSTNGNGISNGTNGHTNGHPNGSAKDVFGSEPFAPRNGVKAMQQQQTTAADPFGMESFEPRELEQAIGAIDKKLAEMRDGFSRGLSFGNDDFSIESLDPLSQKS